MQQSTTRYGKAAIGLLLLSIAAAAPAHAQRNIGSATSIEREVSGTVGGRTRSLSSGAGVFSNENIRTANLSAAQLQFLDDSRLRIGPSASVVLDRFVFNPDQSAKEGTIKVTTGAARWIGGKSKPGTHQVTTPHAVIGVRGTVFDVTVERSRTIVTLREGVIVVCPIAARNNCITLNAPGQTVIVTTTTITGPLPESASPTRFADLCLAAIERASCAFTTTALLGPDPSWDGFYTGVHGGYDRSRSSVTTRGSPAVETSIGLGNVPGSLDTSASSAVGGVQFGYLWQSGPAVFGLEADISGMSANAGQTVTRNTGFGVIVDTAAQHELHALGTFRARAGVAFDRFLVFGSGGLAVGQIDLQGTIIPTPFTNPTYVGARSLVKAGYAAGGGVEYLFPGGFSIRAEYLHYDLGRSDVRMDETTGAIPAGEFAVMRFHTFGDIGRIAINARF
jgi:opacity protein-like surface antigen